VRGTNKCSQDACSDLAVTSFSQNDLCLHHFISCCYENLDRLDIRGRAAEFDKDKSTTLKSFVKECSAKALEVSLACPNLDNLQRGRLLDILLWAGELLPEGGARCACGRG
jgi:hypothetical protein